VQVADRQGPWSDPAHDAVRREIRKGHAKINRNPGPGIAESGIIAADARHASDHSMALLVTERRMCGSLGWREGGEAP
jgi:hypothetical protein